MYNMTMFVKLDNGIPTGYPITLDNMRYLYPNRNWNGIITPQSISDIPYALYEFTTAPTVRDRYMKSIEGAPILKDDNIYYQNWVIVEMTEIEKLEWDRVLAQRIRAERDRLLAKSDWTQLPDCTLNPIDQAKYREYRKQLRDITDRPNFPHNLIRHATMEEFKSQLVYPLDALNGLARVQFEQEQYAKYLTGEPNVLDVDHPLL